MIYTSYYTLGDYEEVFKTHLLPSLKKCNLKYDVKVIENLGSWQINTHIKAEIIKEMLLKYKESIVFLDVDATIEKEPILFEQLEEFDIALHYLDWYKLWRKEEGNPKREALSGTLYLKYNDKILKFLDEWIAENKIITNLEQRNMQKTLEKWKERFQIYNLPPEYCVIKMRDGSIPTWYVKGDTVILHHQVSRQFKNK